MGVCKRDTIGYAILATQKAIRIVVIKNIIKSLAQGRKIVEVKAFKNV